MGITKDLKKLTNQKILLDIIEYPDDRLSFKDNRNVVDFNASGLKELVINMIHTMNRVGGVGLAAPQVGVDIRAAVMIINRKPLVIFNPSVLSQSDETVSIEEGCLSCPGKMVRVPRAQWIEVQYNTLKGDEVVGRFEGVDAIIIQHEIDHLGGMLITDYETASA